MSRYPNVSLEAIRAALTPEELEELNALEKRLCFLPSWNETGRWDELIVIGKLRINPCKPLWDWPEEE